MQLLCLLMKMYIDFIFVHHIVVHGPYYKNTKILFLYTYFILDTIALLSTF